MLVSVQVVWQHAACTVLWMCYITVCCKSKPGLNSVALKSMTRSDVDCKKPKLVENPPGGLGNQEPACGHCSLKEQK